ncbi:hypothetical protein [Domibacillus indicus]|uniref:hypothetical protein n=1 Tax=Domibacillus indicus TaxID=1437523 RepID=UPI000695E15C|nr:hypothetical protein [Domibacillus indicus]
MRNRLLNPILLLILASMLSACSQEVNNFHSPLYTGGSLEIGIVGKPPEMRESNVQFISLTLEDVEKGNIKNADAVFITKDHLPEAAEPEYAAAYLKSPVPFVFIESEKVYLAFIDEELSYEDAHASQSGDYLIGYFHDTYFGLSLYDHQQTKKTIQSCYSRVFSIIENAKHTGEIILE